MPRKEGVCKVNIHFEERLFVCCFFFVLVFICNWLKIKNKAVFLIHTDMRTVSPDNRGKLLVSTHYPKCS